MNHLIANHSEYVTIEMIIDRFAPGGYSDGITIFASNTRPVGYVVDLRREMMSEAKRKINQAAYSSAYYMRRREDLPGLVEDTLAALKQEFVGTPAKIFINQTMPNMHLMGFRFYFVICATSKNIRLSINHPIIANTEFRKMFNTSGRLTWHNTSAHSLMIDNIDLAEGMEIAKEVILNAIKHS